MAQIDIGLMMIVGLIGLLGLGMPIAYALGLVGLVGLYLARGLPSLSFLAGSFPYSSVANLTMIVVPLFLFMGHMAFASGLSRKAFDSARTLVGHLHGGLAIASVGACALFATVSGSSVATAASMAKIAIPEMLRAGYSARLAAGAVAAGGTLGVLIPPSGILVIYAIATGTPLADLLVAALIPGLVTVLVYGAGIMLVARLDRETRSAGLSRPAPWRARARALLGSWEVGLLFLLVMGSIYGGLATPTEAAAVGALVALLIAVARTRGHRGQALWQGLVETGVSTSAIFALIVGAGLFSLGLATTRVPQELAGWVAAQELSQLQTLILILIPFLLLGAFIDGVSMILLMMPIVFPLVERAGIDPVLFGILVTKTTEIGVITPPVGLNVFVVTSAAPEVSLRDTYRGCWPFVVMDLLLIALLIAVPDLALGLL